MSSTLQIIANPESAGGRGRRVLPKLRQTLEEAGVEYRIHLTGHPGHASEIARALEYHPHAPILVLGGDGTLHEVANGLLGSQRPVPPLAVIPVGTGNDFHRMLETSGRLDQLIPVLKRGRIRPFDVGRVTWDGGSAYFVNLLGVGIDVEVLRRRGNFRLFPGLLQYLGALVNAVVTFRPLALSVLFADDTDGELKVEGETLLTAITVGPSVGGGFFISPAARPDDGRLDLFFVERLGILGVARHLPMVLRGTHGSSPRIHLHQLRRARIESSDGTSFSFELDGELMPEASTWLEVEVVPAALRIMEAPGNDPFLDEEETG